MLILSQKRGSRILAHVPGFGTIVITTVRIRGDKVRLGLEGDGVTFLREEVAERFAGGPELLLPIAPETVVETESTSDQEGGTDADAA